MSHEKETTSDPLDDWLNAARWLEPSVQSQQRLRETWNRLRRPSARRQELLAPLSAAAIVAVAIGIAWMTARKAAISPPTIAEATPHVVAPAPAILSGRSPTVLEMMMIRAAEDREKRGKRSSSPASRSVQTASQSPVRHTPPAPRPAAPAPPPVAQAPGPAAPAPPAIAQTPRIQPSAKPPSDRLHWIADLLNNPDDAALGQYLDLVSNRATRADALAALAKIKSPPIDRLLEALSDPHVERRIAAALVLGRIDGPALTRQLIEMVAADQNRREAFIALASSRGADAQNFVRQAERSPSLAGLARSTNIALNELQHTEVQ